MCKKAAVFILFSIFSFFGLLLSINVEAREKLIHWLIETMPEFSIFIPLNEIKTENNIDLDRLQFNYIPPGFVVDNINEGKNIIIYNYATADSKKITIKLIISDEGKVYYDTENVEIEEVNLDGSTAYAWQTDQYTYLLWYRDGIEYHIVGNLTKEEAKKIAQNITLKN